MANAVGSNYPGAVGLFGLLWGWGAALGEARSPGARPLPITVAKRSLLKLESANGLHAEDLKLQGDSAHSVGMVVWSISGSARTGNQLPRQRKHMQPVKQVAKAQATIYPGSTSTSNQL